MDKRVQMAVIGAGRAGSAILGELLKLNYVCVIGVADADPEAEGLKIAKQHNVPVFAEPMQLVEKNEEIDILVEVSGDVLIKQDIKDYFSRVGNRKTIIMHNLVSRLLLSLASGGSDLAPDYHPNDIGIG